MELPALTRRHALVGVAALLALVVVIGRQLAGSGATASVAPRDVAAPVAEAETPRLVVHVVGAVRRPGLYRLAEGARVADAVERAGGPTRKADLALVNLAAPLADGTQVVVPRVVATAAGGAPTGETSATAEAAAGPVHLNTATLEQLDALPGVGPVTAQKILDYRQQVGAFSSVDELDAIDGIGPARLEELRKVVAP
jgi:competence protein ComEA